MASGSTTQTFQISSPGGPGNTRPSDNIPSTPSFPTSTGSSSSTYSNKGGVWAWEEWGVSLGQQMLG
ncbi:hypothetical protein RSOLAG22IIIB_04593 [Rhizoctonia solani]|uniref:Uncharacterized protein n=1 Tax=Rhizoctonia solani TaxID=456999 RepID=A0A0K6FZ57_9AGAM|nr:hypothetical protein RSOLAG22IIIB_04593 [Rhizoctonia solani]